jgi:putative heme d1 biosynthesis radical SAM protein NirJ1
MIGISKLLCGTENYGDRLRYAHGAAAQTRGTVTGHGPVVVWNCTRTCNLKCIHCYADSNNQIYRGELKTQEAKYFINDLSQFKVPVLLLSGGEPLLREDLFELIDYANNRNIRTTLSTNGTLIDEETAHRIKQHGISYVGISLDGIGSSHDAFRRSKGSFDKALNGIRNCRQAGQKVGLRFTISKQNINQLKDIFHLIEEEKINRVCFYHLVYSGRGSEMMKEDISHEEIRSAMDFIIEKTLELGDKIEILTVDNHADAVYLYLQAKKRFPHLADRIFNLIKMNGGNRSGIAIANVDNQGFVHADQFTLQYAFGNVKERKFGDIWIDTTNPVMSKLKNRKPYLQGRCGQCKWLELCNGNFRSRAEAVTGNFWASDPACYLTNEEIGVPQEAGLL